MPLLKLDLLQTLSLAAVVYFVGISLRQRIGWLERLNIPAAVIGGLLFTAVTTAAHNRWFELQLDTSTQPVLLVAKMLPMTHWWCRGFGS